MAIDPNPPPHGSVEHSVLANEVAVWVTPAGKFWAMVDGRVCQSASLPTLRKQVADLLDTRHTSQDVLEGYSFEFYGREEGRLTKRAVLRRKVDKRGREYTTPGGSPLSSYHTIYDLTPEQQTEAQAALLQIAEGHQRLSRIQSAAPFIGLDDLQRPEWKPSLDQQSDQRWRR